MAAREIDPTLSPPSPAATGLLARHAGQTRLVSNIARHAYNIAKV